MWIIAFIVIVICRQSSWGAAAYISYDLDLQIFDIYKSDTTVM